MPDLYYADPAQPLTTEDEELMLLYTWYGLDDGLYEACISRKDIRRLWYKRAVNRYPATKLPPGTAAILSAVRGIFQV